jgi:hypothetical protein
MIHLTDDVKTGLRQFLGTDTATTLFGFIREHPPAEPYPGAVDPHLVQVNYGFNKGIYSTLKYIEELARLEVTETPDKTPTLIDTRSKR